MAEATAFWSVVGGLFGIYIFVAGGVLGLVALVIGLIYLGVGYLCWKSRRAGYVLAIILSIVVDLLELVANLVASAFGAVVFILALLALFFGLSAYRAAKMPTMHL